MKKILLSVSSMVLAISASAQIAAGGTGFTMDNTNGGSNCFVNSAPNNGGIMSDAGSAFVKGDYMTADAGIELQSKDTTKGTESVIWFALPGVDVEKDQCVFLNDLDTAVNLSNHSKISITATSSVAGASIDVFLGSTGKFFPSTSTFNTGNNGASAILTLTFTAADTEETFTFDYLEGLDVTTWEEWDGKSSIQSVGFRAGASNEGPKFNISVVEMGSVVPVGLDEFVSNEATFSIFPNPVTEGVINFTETVETVELYNIQGNLIKSATNTDKLDVAGLNAGIYVIQSAKGYKRVVIK